MLICPLEFTRGLPLKSTEPTNGSDCWYELYPELGVPRPVLPEFSAGELVEMSKFGVGEQAVIGVGGELCFVEVHVVRVS